MNIDKTKDFFITYSPEMKEEDFNKMRDVLNSMGENRVHFAGNKGEWKTPEEMQAISYHTASMW